MAVIPEKVRKKTIVESLEKHLIHQGKVRDIYEVSWRSDILLFIATDRISIFDFVLPVLIPFKGEVLTALTHFWLTKVVKDFPNHLKKSVINPRLNLVHDLKKSFSDIPMERSLVVEKLELPPFEMVFRRHLGGSVYKEYQKTGLVAGQKLPPNLPKWTFFEEPLFTPARRSSTGHDINITSDDYFAERGERGKRAVEMFEKVYRIAYDYARAKGILILDTKFEGDDNVIADEVLTPDSSRFTTLSDWKKAITERRDPIFFDKQIVREWGAEVETPFRIRGINNLNPEDKYHLEFVNHLEVPEEVITETKKRYLQIFQALTDYTLRAYQKNLMFI